MVLKINHVVDVFTKVVNFIGARMRTSIKSQEFAALLEEYETEQADLG